LEIGSITSTRGSGSKCQTCELLREWLESERSKREYYEQIVLSASGLVAKPESEQIDLSHFPTIQKSYTLTHMRDVARKEAIRRADPLAKDSEKSPEELRFERALAEHR
jgi:hypothetical protein